MRFWCLGGGFVSFGYLGEFGLGMVYVFGCFLLFFLICLFGLIYLIWVEFVYLFGVLCCFV